MRDARAAVVGPAAKGLTPSAGRRQGETVQAGAPIWMGSSVRMGLGEGSWPRGAERASLERREVLLAVSEAHSFPDEVVVRRTGVVAR